MQILLRAIISGFGYKIGSELGRFVIEKSGLHKKAPKAAAETEEARPPGGGLPTDPPATQPPVAEPPAEEDPES